MRTAVHYPLVIALAAIALLSSAPGEAGTSHGTITGVVFHDLDGDGARDDGEPGLPGLRVELMTGTGGILSAFTDTEGRYTIYFRAQGEYVLRAVLDKPRAGPCALVGSSFNPLVTSFCLSYSVPWNATSPDSVPIMGEGGPDLVVDFGAQPADVAIVTGVALLETDRAAEGTLIEAVVKGHECGTTTATADWDLNYTIAILGAGKREGCAQRGDTVLFQVGGVMAPETYSYVSHLEREPGTGAFAIVGLTAIQDHAWYWMEQPSDGTLRDGATVEAIVDGTICGSTTMAAPELGSAGFSRLIVPSAEVQPGCGRPGAKVSFVVDGVRAETTLPWRPGLQPIDLALPVPGPRLPDTGSEPADKGGRETPSAVVALAALAVVLMGGGVLLAGRR